MTTKPHYSLDNLLDVLRRPNMTHHEELDSNLKLLHELKRKRRRVGVLALGSYKECRVKNIWWDDSEDKVSFETNESPKKSWSMGVGSISQLNQL